MSRFFFSFLSTFYNNKPQHLSCFGCGYINFVSSKGSTTRACSSSSSISLEGTIRCKANYVPLSPISFLERAAKVYRDRDSIVYGSVKYTWSQTHERCVKVASALSQLGISRGDVVATLAPNIPAMYELHFAIPMAGAIICTLNTRHDSHMISVLLKHSEAKLIFVDTQLVNLATEAFDLLAKAGHELPNVVLVSDSDGSVLDEKLVPNAHDYESLLENGDDGFEIRNPKSEFDPISLNYSSGTTSMPKGVVFNHRGAYLNAIAVVMLQEMRSMPVFLWTPPMFHCNGWSLIWGVASQGGTNICLRRICPQEIFDSIEKYNVTCMGAAPTVLNMLLNYPHKRALPHKVGLLTGGAPPPPQILFAMDELGFNVVHVYGLTESYGIGTYCVWKPEWDSLSPNEKAKMRARQGMKHLCQGDVDIKDPVTMESVPADAKTIGEVMFRGNTVMDGYFKDLKETEKALKDGWLRSGDLAVKYPDGYIEVKDRSKDIIISGGENISSLEVESVLYSHPAILEAAVVGRPDDHWGQTPCAFVVLKEGFNVSAQDIIIFCRDHLPHYMAPKTVVFEELPKTSTGKVQKFVLREKAKALGSLS